MSDDEIKKIQTDMMIQGFPLEVKASEILEAHGWEVTNQASYLDLETRKNRTIDILAEKNVYRSSEFVFDIWLCIECKKVAKPWVFYTTDLDLSKEGLQRKIVSSTHFSVNKSAQEKGNLKKRLNLVTGIFLLQNYYSKSIFKKLAHSSFEPFTKGEGLSIHKARMQVCNMVLHLEKNVGVDALFMIASPYILLYLPVIVVDGRVFFYQNSQLNSIEGLHYHVPYYQASFLIDVVTAKSFEEYLNNLEQLIRNVKIV